MEYELAFLKALILTVLLEITMAAALKRFTGRRFVAFFSLERMTDGNPFSYGRLAVMVALASILTLPYVWFVLPAFLPHGIVYAVTAEVSVTIVEALWYFFCMRPFGAQIQASLSAKDLAARIKLRKKRAAAFNTAVILSVFANAFSYLAGTLLF